MAPTSIMAKAEREPVGASARALRCVLAAAAIWAAGAGLSQAQTVVSPDDPDLRCAVIGLAIAGMGAGDNQQMQAGTLIALYYIGRLEGRVPGLDLEESIFAVSQNLSPAQIDAERLRCAGEVQAMGETMTDIGRNLQRRGGGAQPAPAKASRRP